jgi:hypothetical protein
MRQHKEKSINNIIPRSISIIQKPMYYFLLNSFKSWPKDSSIPFEKLTTLLNYYIQPWIFSEDKEYNENWKYYISSSYLFYTELLSTFNIFILNNDLIFSNNMNDINLIYNYYLNYENESLVVFLKECENYLIFYFSDDKNFKNFNLKKFYYNCKI